MGAHPLTPEDQLSEHFKRSEFLCKCGHCSLMEVDPVLIDGLEKLRELIGKPIVIDDGIRCPAHNKAVGGAAHSLHLDGRAADIRADGLTARQLYAMADTITELSGLGVADLQGYLHVDVGPVRKWVYAKDGKPERWSDEPVAA